VYWFPDPEGTSKIVTLAIPDGDCPVGGVKRPPFIIIIMAGGMPGGVPLGSPLGEGPMDPVVPGPVVPVPGAPIPVLPAFLDIIFIIAGGIMPVEGMFPVGGIMPVEGIVPVGGFVPVPDFGVWASANETNTAHAAATPASQW